MINYSLNYNFAKKKNRNLISLIKCQLVSCPKASDLSSFLKLNLNEYGNLIIFFIKKWTNTKIIDFKKEKRSFYGIWRKLEDKKIG